LNVSGRAIKGLATFLPSVSRPDKRRRESGRSIARPKLPPFRAGKSWRVPFPPVIAEGVPVLALPFVLVARWPISKMLRALSVEALRMPPASGRRGNFGRLLEIPIGYHSLAKHVLDSFLLRNHALHKIVDTLDSSFRGVRAVHDPRYCSKSVEGLRNGEFLRARWDAGGGHQVREVIEIAF
jgi:hypothetical protein